MDAELFFFPPHWTEAVTWLYLAALLRELVSPRAKERDNQTQVSTEALLLLDPFQILGQQCHRNEYCFHWTLRQANLFIKRDNLCTREKAGKTMPALQVEGASYFYNKREGLSHDH